ncbi:MAG TPA: hypothetical protein VFD05_01345 [Bacilli bacterium]|nr:hypothetical protein [Bacilli bacterium]
MNNKKRLITLMTILFTLTGCKAVQETFDRNAFHSNDFSGNYYSSMPARYQENNYLEKGPNFPPAYAEYSPFQNVYDEIISRDVDSKRISFADAVKMYGNNLAQELQKDGAPKAEVEEELRKSENATFYKYAKLNSLSDAAYLDESVRESFKRGVFSKLTDGDVTCRGDGALSRVQITEAGFGKTFDHELISYRHLYISLRGGTDISNEALYELGIPRPTRAKIILNVDFYIEKSTTNVATKYRLALPIDNLYVDNNALVNIISVDLSYLFIILDDTDVPKNGLTRTSGIAFSFELVEHDVIKPLGEAKNDDYQFAVMLYEVMLPNSSWR